LTNAAGAFVNVQEALSASGIEPREARLLLAAATGFSEAAVLGFPERPLPGEAEKAYLSFVSRRAAGEPIAYILGRREFYGLELEVTPAVLIPRPETELLVDLALARKPASVLDLGSGSGAIALALKRHLPSARVVASDALSAGEVDERLGDLEMVRPQPAFPDIERALVAGPRSRVIRGPREHPREVAQASRDVRMVGTERLLLDRECALEEWLRICVVTGQHEQMPQPSET